MPQGKDDSIKGASTKKVEVVRVGSFQNDGFLDDHNALLFPRNAKFSDLLTNASGKSLDDTFAATVPLRKDFQQILENAQRTSRVISDLRNRYGRQQGRPVVFQGISDQEFRARNPDCRSLSGGFTFK